MSKRERKKELIKKYIKNAAGGWSAYSYGNIPKQLVRNACISYAGAVQYDDVLGLIDITITGSGKKGMLFTSQRVYYDNGMLENRGNVTYKQIADNGTIPGDVFGKAYNKQALLELLSGLSKIEGENFGSKMNDINSSIDSLNNGVQQISDTINKGMDLANAIIKLFDSGNESEDNTSENR